MKFFQKSTAILIIALLFVTMVPTAAAADNDKGITYTEVNEMVYAVTEVNIRSGPGLKYGKVGMLYYGEAIQRIGIGDNGWSKVMYNDEVAYMFSEYLSTVRPVVDAPDTDYSALNRQIAIANGLKKAEYTSESWSVLSDALSRAIKALSNDKQATVDQCRKNLSAAIAGLVKVDRSALQEVLDAADDFVDGDESNDAWFELVEAVNNGKALVGGNDQAAIDAAAAQIDEILARVKTIVDVQSTPEIVTQEVKVEVPPTDDYCNIPAHRVWPILFFCSLALNLALVAVIVFYVYTKKKNQKDDTPLVDYDIDDDVF